MRSAVFKRIVLAVAALGVVAGLTACQSAVAGTPTAAPAAGPERVAFAPYVDVSVKRPDLAAVAKATGLKHVVLAFALAGKGGSCDPAWGGTKPLDDLKPDIDAFRAAGGDVTVATGGAVGTYLENVCRTSDELAGAYGKLLDATGSTWLDVDIETGIRPDVVVDALAQVQRSRGTDVTLTLPVDLGGLTPAGLDLVRRAAAANVTVTVNAMDMNFRTGGDWGQAMVDAAQAVLDQLRQVYPEASEAVQNRTLGITVMIGRNDAGPITRVADAQKVLDFARSRGIGRLGIWSLGRDSGACPKRAKAAVDCSGIAQANLEFTKLLNGFAVA